MKKILFINNSLDNGGAEKVLVNLINNLPQNLYEITLFTIYSSGIYDDKIEDGVRYRYIFKKKNSFLQKLFLGFFCKVLPIKALHKLFLRDRFDYEIAFMQGFPTEMVRKSPNKKSQKIAFVHSDFSTNFDVKTLYKSTEKCFNAYKSFDKVCFVSETVKNGFIKTVGDLQNSYVVYNVIDRDDILEKAEENCEIARDKDVFRIVTVGRLVKVKAIERIIYAVNNLKTDYPNLELLIIGDGEERLFLQRIISENNLEEKVKILGFKDNPYKYINCCDLYVCSSISEGYSTAVIEALIVGKPVLTTEVSGMREIFGETNCGIIVENSDGKIEEGLRSILQNEDMFVKMKKDAELRSSQFKMEKQIDSFLNIVKN